MYDIGNNNVILKEMSPEETSASFFQSILSIFHSYYQFQSIPEVQEFVLPPNENLSGLGRILFEEQEDYFFLGIQFSKEIYEKLKNPNLMTVNDISVVAEELSHFKFLADVAENSSQTNLLILESMGEIDRFLCMMHWNYHNHLEHKIEQCWNNFHELCDFVFTGDRFYGENKNLYIAAENLAFRHLKEAFSQNWDNSHVNFSKINPSAKSYLSKLRGQYLLSCSRHDLVG
jgi:hypothetical protein